MVADVLDAPDAVMRTAPVSGRRDGDRRHRPAASTWACSPPAGCGRCRRAMSYELWLMGPNGERPAGMLTSGQGHGRAGRLGR